MMKGWRLLTFVLIGALLAVAAPRVGLMAGMVAHHGGMLADTSAMGDCPHVPADPACAADGVSDGSACALACALPALALAGDGGPLGVVSPSSLAMPRGFNRPLGRLSAPDPQPPRA